MKIMNRILLLGLAGSLLATGCSFSAKQPRENVGFGGGGASIKLTFEQQIQVSRLIVRGIPVSDTVRPLTEKQDIPESEKAEPLYQKAVPYHDVVVQVLEYLKGSGPAELSVARLATHAGFGGEYQPSEPIIGQEQIFFLFPGQGIWVNTYLLSGVKDGLAQVNNGTVSFSSGTTMSLDELRTLVRESAKETPAP